MTKHAVNPSLEARRWFATLGFPMPGKQVQPVPSGTGVHRSA
ncbi:hypothetical protein [Nitrosococcus wardiae]|nr:hypothetical protein [Nitrosococcus wardiae]